jgi:hypothetical protein
MLDSLATLPEHARCREMRVRTPDPRTFASTSAGPVGQAEGQGPKRPGMPNCSGFPALASCRALAAGCLLLMPLTTRRHAWFERTVHGTPNRLYGVGAATDSLSMLVYRC